MTGVTGTAGDAVFNVVSVVGNAALPRGSFMSGATKSGVSTNRGTIVELIVDGKLGTESGGSASLLTIGSNVLTLRVSSVSLTEDDSVSTNLGSVGWLMFAVVLRLSTMQWSELMWFKQVFTISWVTSIDGVIVDFSRIFSKGVVPQVN